MSTDSDQAQYSSRALRGQSRIQLTRGNAAGAVSTASEAVAVDRHLSPTGSIETVFDLQALARAQMTAKQFAQASSNAQEAAAMLGCLEPDNSAAMSRAKDLIATIEKGGPRK